MKSRPDSREPTLCQSRCPVSRASANLAYTPQGKQSAVWRLQQRLVAPGPDSVLPAYLCLDCLACRENCDHGVDVPANLSAARHEWAREVTPLVSEAELRYDTEAAWRLLSSAAPSWRRMDQCQALLVPGMEMLTEENFDLLEALFRALDRLGDLVLGVNRDSVLECGHHPYAHGHLDPARRMARQARKRFARYSKVVFASPHCASFVRLKWPEADLQIERQFATLLEFLGKRIDFARSGFYRRKVAYHDPCHLGRHLGLYQLPRDILKWATNDRPVELLYSRQRSLCCGGGHPLPIVAPQVSGEVARFLAEEFRRTEAEELVVACPQCRARLRADAPEIPVRHLVEILAEVTP
jgi:Fe-S oxidoreductase